MESEHNKKLKRTSHINTTFISHHTTTMNTNTNEFQCCQCNQTYLDSEHLPAVHKTLDDTYAITDPDSRFCTQCVQDNDILFVQLITGIFLFILIYYLCNLLA
jgi:hypothetical protein